MTLREERNQILKAQKGKAYRIAVELPSDVNKYALNFLNIYNNVRENDDLLKVYNTSGNTVYVVVKEEVKDAAVDWLEWLGKIVTVTEVKTITPIVPFYNDDSDFDEWFGAEFLAVDYE